jgi:hypothetical protein
VTAATTSDTITTIRSGYQRFAEQDIPGLMALLADDIEWTIPGPAGVDGVYRGHEGVGEFFGKLPYPELEVRPESFVADGDRVVAIGRHFGKSPSGVAFEVGFAHVWEAGADGKLVSFHEYTDTEKLGQALS